MNNQGDEDLLAAVYGISTWTLDHVLDLHNPLFFSAQSLGKVKVTQSPIDSVT